MSLPRFKSTSPIVIICAALCAVLGGATSVLATTSFDQLGSDIDAEAAGDNSGYSVAMSSDGTTVAVGAKSNDGNGDFAGHVRVFEFSGGSWSQLGSDIDAEAAGDNFGESIALSADGTTLAVGAPMNDGTGMNGGHVRVFGFSGGNWNQLGSDIDAEAAYDNFGESIAISADGNRVVVGAVGNDTTGLNAGQVRVFDLLMGEWVQAGPDINGEAADDEFGRSVGISDDGSRIVVGAKSTDSNGANAGSAYIYDLNSGNWDLTQTFIGEVAGDNFGTAVSMTGDGTTVAVGATGNDGPNGDSYSAGHVRVFQFSDGSWSQAGSDIDGEAQSDQLGKSLALSSDGKILAAGAPGNDGTGSGAGHVRMYQFADGVWTQLGDDIDGEAAGDASGFSLSLSSDGETVAIGAYLNAGSGDYAGHVRVYSVSTAATLNITYDSQGGSAISDGDATTTSGGSISVLPTDPTRDGYTFAGWFTAASDGTQITAGEAHNQTTDFTLYAQWTENPVTTTTEVPATTTTDVSVTTTTDVPSDLLLPSTGSENTSEFLTFATMSGLLGAGVALIVIIRRRMHIG